MKKLIIFVLLASTLAMAGEINHTWIEFVTWDEYVEKEDSVLAVVDTVSMDTALAVVDTVSMDSALAVVDTVSMDTATVTIRQFVDLEIVNWPDTVITKRQPQPVKQPDGTYVIPAILVEGYDTTYTLGLAMLTWREVTE